MDISLSILNIDYNHIKRKLDQFKTKIKYLHLDIMDGHFVPNISFGPALVRSLDKENDFIMDTHLMISEPKKYIESFVKAGSDYITFHLEAVENVSELISYIHSFHIKAGVSIKPTTKVEELIPYLSDLDLILIMSVEPGFGGQKFLESSIEKVKKLKQWKEEQKLSYLISIDGGIDDVSLPKVKEYLDLAVVGSYLTSAQDFKENISKLLA